MEKLISSKIVFECPIFKVEEAEVELSDGTRAKRWYVVKRDAVAVVCVKNGNIIMMREYRSASGTVEWRIPAGGVHGNEDPKDAAIREVREEIGLEPLDIKPLRSFTNTSSWIKQTTHCFVATRLRENPLDTGEKEEREIEIKELNFREIKALLEQNEISHNVIARCLKMVIDE